MDAIQAIKQRRSIRKYKATPISKEIIEDIVDCGRLAPTAINIQPWEFIVITKPEIRRKVAAVTDSGKFILDAPVCIVVFCKETPYYLEDGSAATENIMVAARAYNLGSCWIAGDRKPYVKELRQLLGVPNDYRLISLVTIGQAAEDPRPPKKSLQQVTHWESW